VPKTIRAEVLKISHDSVWSGHLGQRRTTERVFRKYYWYEFREDVNLWVTACDRCATAKRSVKKPRAPLGDMRVGAPLDRLCIDILGPLPVSTKGNKYVLVVCDSFTKWAEAFPIPDQTARTCAEVLVEQVITRLGSPLDLHSDQGRQFESDLFKELCELLHIRKTRTSSHRPQCNGQCERFNRTLLSMIRAFLNDHQEDWDQYVSCLTAAYRATPHEATGITPNQMMLGRELRFPGELHAFQSEENISPGRYCHELRESMMQSHAIARDHLKQASTKQRANYDVKVSFYSFRPGDLVWCLNESRKEGVCPKLQPTFKGPYLVLKKVSELDYRIQLDRYGTTRLLHHDKLKAYKGPKVLPWAKKALADHVLHH